MGRTGTTMALLGALVAALVLAFAPGALAADGSAYTSA
jgi:hypothetical protein